MMRRSRLFMGLKRNGTPVRLTFLGGRHCAETQLLDAEKAVVVGVEGYARVVLARHTERFHGHVLEGEQKLGAVGEQKIDIGAGELHDEVRRLDVAGLRRGFQNLVLEIEIGVIEDGLEKVLDLRAGGG